MTFFRRIHGNVQTDTVALGRPVVRATCRHLPSPSSPFPRKIGCRPSRDAQSEVEGEVLSLDTPFTKAISVTAFVGLSLSPADSVETRRVLAASILSEPL